jgi:GDPmannose 4,6-dehydratase
LLLGDPSKAKRLLGWKASTSTEQLAAIMVEHDLEIAKRELHNQSFKT